LRPRIGASTLVATATSKLTGAAEALHSQRVVLEGGRALDELTEHSIVVTGGQS
jgi:hypothetical protein